MSSRKRLNKLWKLVLNLQDAVDTFRLKKPSMRKDTVNAVVSTTLSEFAIFDRDWKLMMGLNFISIAYSGLTLRHISFKGQFSVE